jgi:outer membrane protein assembly factor BamD (BamD/ComL family)
MSSDSGGCLQRYKWHIIVTLAIAVPISLWIVFGSRPGTPSQLSRWLWVGSLLLLGAMVILLAYVCTIVASFRDSSAKLEEVSKALERIGDRLEELCQSTRLSEKTKAIAFRDSERASLQEAVMQKLNARDYDAAYEVIDEIARRSEYSDLAEQLRCHVERHRQSVRDEKIEPVIAQIERLFDEGQWSKATVQIEGLIKANPDSERARSMRQRLYIKKEEKKKALLSAWDDAVKRQDTDRSLEILKDLDMYLTHNEALALQEAAKDVFRNKLHNLGVRFSIAVSDRHWAEALDVGQQIIAEFPNSRMSEEIRGRLDILKQNVQLSV